MHIVRLQLGLSVSRDTDNGVQGLGFWHHLPWCTYEFIKSSDKFATNKKTCHSLYALLV